MSARAKGAQQPRNFSRLKTYFFSYLLLVVLLLSGIGLVVYTIVLDTLHSVVEQSNVNALKQTRDHIDQRLSELQRLSAQLSLNTKLLPYAVTQEGYESLQAVQELSSFVSANSFLLDIGIHYTEKNVNKIYAASGVYDLSSFFGMTYPFRKIIPADAQSWFEGIRTPHFYPLQSIKNNGASSAFETALYVYPVPNDGTKPYETIVYIVNGAELTKTLGSGFKSFEGAAFIVDQEGNLVASVSNTGGSPLDVGEIREHMAGAVGSSVQTFKLQGRSYSAVRLDSTVEQWSYYTVMPTGQFLDRVRKVQVVFYVTIAVALLTGVGLSFVLASHNYKPVIKLMELVRSKNPAGTAVHQKDEFGWISAAIDEIATENNSLRSRLQTKSAMLKDKVLFDLLKGNMKSWKELEEPLEDAGMNLTTEQFAMLLIVIDGYRTFEQANSLMIQNLLKYSIVNVAEEISLEAGTGYGIDLGENRGIAVLIGLSHTNGPDQVVTGAAEKIRQFFEWNFPFTVTVGVSETFENVLQTPLHYRQAADAVDSRFKKGPNRSIGFRELADAGRQTSYPDVSKDGAFRLIQAIRLGNVTEIAGIVRTEIQEVSWQEMSASAVRSRCRLLIDAVFREQMELSLACPGQVLEEEAMLQAFAFETHEQFEQSMIRYGEALAVEMERKKESKHFELRDKLKEYVDLHYMNDSLSLNAIADAAGMSPAYISRYFKNQMGIAISEYVDVVRMEKAKELLQMGAITVKEVASLTGYSDQTHFIRKFKRKEGVTPQQYKHLFSSSDKM